MVGRLSTFFNTKSLIVLFVSLVFIALNIIGFSYNFDYFFIIPASIILLIVSFYYPRYFFYFIVFFTPLSIDFNIESYGLTVSAPSEPMTLVLMGLFILGLLTQKIKLSNVNYKNLIFIAVAFHIFIMILTTFSSTIPIVSIKYTFNRLWFFIVFFLFGSFVFEKDKNIRLFFNIFILGLILVIFYTLNVHKDYSFLKEFKNRVSDPFFYDHTIYSCTISMFVPYMLLVFLYPKNFGYKNLSRFISFPILVILLVGIYFSYSRGSYIGVGVALLLGLTLILKIPKIIIGGGIALVALLLVMNLDTINQFVSKNKSESGDNKSGIESHIQSISNIKTDESNTERLNRWSCAIRMFKEKPLTGWGPGTYMFQYAPFQLSHELTRISTNHSTLGNAHSEYFGALADSGIFGTLSVFGIIGAFLYSGIYLFRKGKNQAIKYHSLAALLGLTAYFIHAFMNNFWEQDKCAVPIYAMLAILTINLKKNKSS